jgi:hypothetical protein
MDPSLRVAAKIRPYFILALDGGLATAFGLGFPPRLRLDGFSLATLRVSICRYALGALSRDRSNIQQ